MMVNYGYLLFSDARKSRRGISTSLAISLASTRGGFSCRSGSRARLGIQRRTNEASSIITSSARILTWCSRAGTPRPGYGSRSVEINYDILRGEVELQNDTKKKLLNIFSASNPALFRQKKSHKIEKINASLADLKSEASFIGLVAKKLDATPPGTGNRETTFGREEVVCGIIAALTNSNNQEKYLSVMAVVGMPGLGKTTLAKSIFNDKRDIDRCFDKKIWALLNSLEEELTGRRYVLVLDDVWNENDILWSSLISCLSKLNSARGSVVIVTTRNTNVALITETLLRCDLGQLSADDCWSILKGEAFSDGNAQTDSELQKFGRTIAQKCAGVPLVAKSHRMHKLKSLGAEFYGCRTTGAALFPALKGLNILECPALIEWKEAVVVMPLPTDEKVAPVVFPCLEQLTLFLYRIQKCSCSFSISPKVEVRFVASIENISSRLTTLTSLEMHGANALTCLPAGMVEENHNLQSLLMRNCEKLRQLHKGLDTLPLLAKLTVRNCPCLELIPVTRGKTCLRELVIEDCKTLSSSLSGLEDCTALEMLRISCCPNLTSIPISPSLLALDIEGCDELSSLPSGLEHCTSLQDLAIANCPKITSLSIRNLPSLCELHISNWRGSKNLQTTFLDEEELYLHGCASLHRVNIVECHGFTSMLSGLRSCTSLRSLHIHDSQNLRRLPVDGLQSCTCLEHLEMSRCPKLEALPSSDTLASLRHFSIQ
ncbi:hypothetical protein DVH24_029864 [Malus domestica]|uniref:NB-ARC domain-containing protein n=2 Tax=Malus domestica TaxID=3750 RepID=A0A498I1Y9_MALDO|nr:hypothetical protein DVH24_029864 [Malus domestica]